MKADTMETETRGALEPMPILDEDLSPDSDSYSSSLCPMINSTQQRQSNSDLEGKQQYENKEKLQCPTGRGRRPSKFMLECTSVKRFQTSGDINLGGSQILSPLGYERKSFSVNWIPGREETVSRRDETVSPVITPGKSCEPRGWAVSKPVGLDPFMSLLVCPITREVFREPCTLVADGWTYERGALIAWLQFGYDISPTTGENLHGITAFADSKVMSKLLSNFEVLSPFDPIELKRLAWERYEELTSSWRGSKETPGTAEVLCMPNSKRSVSAPHSQLHSNVPKPVSADRICVSKARQSSPAILPIPSNPQPSSLRSFSCPPQPVELAQLSSPYERQLSDHLSSRSYSNILSSDRNREMMPVDDWESHKRGMLEMKLLKKLRKYPQRGTWTMEEPTKFWFVRLDNEWQGDDFRDWIVNETRVTVVSIKDTIHHKLAEEWADKLNMRSESIGWFTPPFHGDLKIPVHTSIKNPSKEFKKGETIRFNLETLHVRDAVNCRYGPEDDNLPRHLGHQREDNGRSSYATAMFSVSVKFVRDDVMPDGEYYCNIACYGVRDALTNRVVNLSREGGLQPGELPSSRLSEQLQKIVQKHGVGTLVQRGESWFCVLSKLWQDQREEFLNQAKKDFKDVECYIKFCKPYRELTVSKESDKGQTEEDFMKWEVEGEVLEVALGHLDTSQLDNVNTINFNIQYLLHEVVGDKLKINARVVFPDLYGRDGDDAQYYFNIATVTPAYKFDETATPCETFE